MEVAKTRKIKRLYLVNRDFQLRYVRLALLVGLCSTLMTTVLLLFPLVQFRVIRFPLFLPQPFLWAMAAAILINFLTVAFLGIMVTHRIAGPMFSLGRHMRQLEVGEKLTPLTIRATDDLKYLVRTYNGFINHLRQGTEADLMALDELLATLQQGPSQGEKAVQLAEALKQKLAGRL